MIPSNPSDAAELRRQAEARLSEKQKTQRSQAGAERTSHDTQRLVLELQIHQIELEMQNEQLEQARAETEAALELYTDLYEFAPAGYFTLDRDRDDPTGKPDRLGPARGGSLSVGEPSLSGFLLPRISVPYSGPSWRRYLLVSHEKLAKSCS